MVQSFGRAAEPSHVDPQPALALPPVQIPAVLVLDAEAMRTVVDQIRAQVADAVRAGFAEALGEYDPEAAEVFSAGAADPAPEQLADLAR